MALSRSDKEEIAALFESFSERLTTGRKVKTAEEQALEVLGRALAPTITGPRYVPLEEQVFGEVFESITVPSKRKKRMSQFNRAVKEGMKLVKASPSYGKKGSISNAKKAFSAVTKTVSKVNRGKPKPKTGVLKKVATVAAKILKTKPKAKGRTAQRARAKKARADYERYRRAQARKKKQMAADARRRR